MAEISLGQPGRMFVYWSEGTAMTDWLKENLPGANMRAVHTGK